MSSQTHAVSDTAADQTTPPPSTSVPRPPSSMPLPGLPLAVDPKRVLWWGGLAALAAIGVIEWPVAAVVGAGSYVAERWAREDARRAARPAS